MAWKPDYATHLDLKGHLKLSVDSHDTELKRVVSSASRAIDRHCNRQFGNLGAGNGQTRTFDAVWDQDRGLYVTEIDDLMTTDNLVVTVNGSPVAAADYLLEPRNAAVEAIPWETIATRAATAPTLGSGPCTVEMFAEWGWSAFPTEVVTATLLQAAELFTRADAPFGVAGSPDVGSEMRLLSRLDPDVINMLAGLRRVKLFA